MADINTFNKSATSTSVSNMNINFTNNIENHVGRAEHNGSISNTEVMDFEMDAVTISIPEKYEQAVGAKSVSKVESILNKLGDYIVEGVATATVAATSALSGVLKVAENAMDGVLWVAVEAAEIFNADTTGLKEFIKEDLTAKANVALYEETDLGRFINEKSAFEYDSDIAVKIQNGTKTVAKIGTAAVLTIASGGTASGLAGFIVGTGDAVENMYNKHGIDTTALQDVAIAGQGLLEALSWIANGKLGEGAYNIAKDMVKDGAGAVLSDAIQHIFSKDFLREQLRNALSLKDVNGKLNINACLNYLMSLFGSAKEFGPALAGDESWLEASGEFALSYVKYLGLNVLEDFFKDYIKGYKQGQHEVDKLVDELKDSGLIDNIQPIQKGTTLEETRAWRKSVLDSDHKEVVDGITFISTTDEGLERLKSLYEKAKNESAEAGALVLAFGSGDYITDITFPGDERSFYLGNVIAISEKELTMQNVNTLLHEMTHGVDGKTGFVDSDGLSGLVRRYSEMIKNRDFSQFPSTFEKDYNELATQMWSLLDSHDTELKMAIFEELSSKVENWDELSSAVQKELFENEYEILYNALFSAGMKQYGITVVSDMYDALLGGKLHSTTPYFNGHGTDYYSKAGTREKEILANYGSLLCTGQTGLLDKYFPPGLKDELELAYRKMLHQYVLGN